MGKEYTRKVEVVSEVPSMGSVIFFDDMEGVLKWAKAGTGADHDVTKDASIAFNGLASLKLITKATTPADGDYVQAVRFAGAVVGERYSLEAWFYFVDEAKVEFIKFNLAIFDGVNVWTSGVLYDPTANKWRYYRFDLVVVDLPGGAQELNEGAWHRVYLEFDKADLKYVKLVCDSLEVDMSELVLHKGTSAVEGRLTAQIEVEAAGAAQATSYVDDVLIRAE